jgi:hypothetical protein
MHHNRSAGLTLIIGVTAPLLIIGMHSTAGDLTGDSGSRQVVVNYLVHGVALAAQPLVFLGLLGVSRYLEWSEMAIAALVVYGFGIVAVLPAAVLSGFVAPDVIERMRVTGATPDARYEALLAYTGFLNQGFARINVIASGAAVTFWGCAMWRRRRFPRATAVIGMVVGTALAVGTLTGYLRLNVRGIVIVTLLQAIWMVLVAVHLLRADDVTVTQARAV